MRSFFSRLFRFLKGILLFFIGKVEDQAPEAVLAAEMDNFNRAVADFNNGLAKQAGLAARLENQIKAGKGNVVALTSRIQALLKLGTPGEREKAAALAVTLNQTKAELVENEKQMVTAEDMLKNLTRQRDTFVKEARNKIDAVKGKISQVKIAEAQGKLAEMVSSQQFNPDGSGLSSLETRLDERVADAQGKLRVASDAVASSPWAVSAEEQKANEASALADFEASLNAPSEPQA